MGPGDIIYQYIKSGHIKIPKSGLSILDVGFKEPGSFFLLDERVGFKKYIGIDRIKEKDCSVSYNNGSVTVNITHKVIEEYHEYCKCIGGSPLSELNFKDKYKFFWGTDMVLFNFESLNEFQFNLGVFSKVLNKLKTQDEAKSIIEKYHSISAEEAYLYVAVTKEGNRQSCDYDCQYTKAEFYSLTEKNWQLIEEDSSDIGFHAGLFRKLY